MNIMRNILKWLSFKFYTCKIQKWVVKSGRGEAVVNDNPLKLLRSCNVNEALMFHNNYLAFGRYVHLGGHFEKKQWRMCILLFGDHSILIVSYVRN